MSYNSVKAFNKIVALNDIGGTGMLNLTTDLGHADFTNHKWCIAIQSVILHMKTIGTSSDDTVEFLIFIQCSHSQNLERTLEGKLVPSWNILATVNTSNLVKKEAHSVTSFSPPIFFPFDPYVGDSAQFLSRRGNDSGLGASAMEVFDVKLIVLMQPDCVL